MPWSAKDAHAKTHKAHTPHERAVWAKIANSNLSKGDASAIRIANAAIANMKGKR